jgi:hypothetical protein
MMDWNAISAITRGLAAFAPPVFGIASSGGTDAATGFDAIACVDVNAEGDLIKFAEDVAVNRSVPVRTFATVAEAEQWLRERPRDA